MTQQGDPVTDPADPTPAPDPAPAADKTFTQADLDRIVQDRLARQKAQFGDYEDLKAKASKLEELEQASKTDLERAQARAVELEQQAKTAIEQAREALLRSAVVAEAARKNVIDPDAAVALIDRAGIELDDTGTPTNIADAMEALLTARPYLVGGTRAASADQGARTQDATGAITREQLKTMSPADIVKAQNEGRLDHLTGSKP